MATLEKDRGNGVIEELLLNLSKNGGKIFGLSDMVSVIRSAYDHTNFNGDCIRGLPAQTCREREMIIIDGGSTDGAGEVVASFKETGIGYIRPEKKGAERLSGTCKAASNAAWRLYDCARRR
jgi:hypothetical protein